MDFDYQVGGIVPERVNDFWGKYIVAASRSETDSVTFLFYAQDFENSPYGKTLTHDRVAKHFELVPSDLTKTVLGGGRMLECDGILSFEDYSLSYGGVPSSVLREFGELLADGRPVEIDDMDDIGSVIKWHNWEEFGVFRE